MTNLSNPIAAVKAGPVVVTVTSYASIPFVPNNNNNQLHTIITIIITALLLITAAIDHKGEAVISTCMEKNRYGLVDVGVVTSQPLYEI